MPVLQGRRYTLRSMRDPLLCHKDLRRERHGGLAVYLTPGVELHEALALLEAPGESLKESRKGSVHRVGDYVVKASAPGTLNTIKRTARRARYRQAWLAAHHLQAHGIGVPEPVAFFERRRAGVISGHAMISRHLDGQRNVEQFAVGLCKRGAGLDTITLFLDALAKSVRALEAAGAYHADLSGKNIFTRDGARFTFIDLDAVFLGVPYTDERRVLNHVQLWDSFCDFVHERFLVPFIQKMLPPDIDHRNWLAWVRHIQQQRRHKLELRYARRGEVRPSQMDMPE